MNIEVEVDQVLNLKADPQGRVSLGPEYSDRVVKVVIANDKEE